VPVATANTMAPHVPNHLSNLDNDHNNKINVLPKLVAPSILLKYSGTKGI